MRPPRGLPLAIRVVLHTILFGLFLSVTPYVSYAQTTSTLPKPWNDAVTILADEVAAAMSPTSVTLEVENISSLDASHVGAIGVALREQLQHHSFEFGSASSTAKESAVQLRFTLSESVTEFVWIIHVFNDSGDASSTPTMIVAVSKSGFDAVETDEQSLSLEKRLVWKQPEKLLDFALLNDSFSGQPLLLVLETNRLTTYKLASSQWQLSRTSPTPQATPPSRDSQGTIDLKEGKISLKGFECVGDPNLAGVLQCKTYTPARRLGGPFVKIPGLPNSVGAGIEEKCQGKFVSLFTAESDWTQPDSIRGYMAKGIPLPVVPAGNTLEFDGPVIVLHSGPEDSSARAIVHNLKTGDYEAYIVTATCSN
jgi:hypothetical protein